MCCSQTSLSCPTSKYENPAHDQHTSKDGLSIKDKIHTQKKQINLEKKSINRAKTLKIYIINIFRGGTEGIINMKQENEIGNNKELLGKNIAKMKSLV